LTGLKDDLMVPTVKVELLGVAYDVDPSLKNTPVMAFDKALPIFEQFLGSIRLREANARALEKLELTMPEKRK
ncbi:MAG: hypothetical protein LBI92_07725, partial [Azoarcus sp.]|nr:hypothetical protein [Azoarcus sp.]